jgi:hypothetical protein
VSLALGSDSRRRLLAQHTEAHASPRRQGEKTMTKRRPVIAVAALLCAGMLTACGGGDGSGDYCNTIKDAVDNDESLTEAEGMDLAKKVRDQAPDEVRDDWDALIDAYNSIGGGDLSDLDPSTLTKMQDAVDNITKFTKDECDVDLEET